VEATNASGSTGFEIGPLGRQHLLYLIPLPHGQGSFLPIAFGRFGSFIIGAI
jgi:hypothetical protein